jgi:hypothetical protein
MGRHTQRELVPILVRLVDNATAKGATAHRDAARAELRRLLAEENWNTSFVLNNISVRRCRYIASLGHPVPTKWMFREYGRGVSDDPWRRDD